MSRKSFAAAVLLALAAFLAPAPAAFAESASTSASTVQGVPPTGDIPLCC
ncbi:hypothetical protein [Kitasatospora sp. NPDC094015]